MKLILITATRAILIPGHDRIEKGQVIAAVKTAEPAAVKILQSVFNRTYYELETQDLPEKRPLPTDAAEAQEEIKVLRAQVEEFERALASVATDIATAGPVELLTPEEADEATTFARITQQMSDETLIAIPGIGGKNVARVRAWADDQIAAAATAAAIDAEAAAAAEGEDTPAAADAEAPAAADEAATEEEAADQDTDKVQA